MTEFNNVISGSTPTLVDFYAKWCGPCKTQSLELERVQAEIGDKARVLKVDVDHDNDLAAIYHIQSIPTLILFKEGKALWRASGVRTADVILDRIYQSLT